MDKQRRTSAIGAAKARKKAGASSQEEKHRRVVLSQYLHISYLVAVLCRWRHMIYNDVESNDMAIAARWRWGAIIIGSLERISVSARVKNCFIICFLYLVLRMLRIARLASRRYLQKTLIVLSLSRRRKAFEASCHLYHQRARVCLLPYVETRVLTVQHEDRAGTRRAAPHGIGALLAQRVSRAAAGVGLGGIMICGEGRRRRGSLRPAHRESGALFALLVSNKQRYQARHGIMVDGKKQAAAPRAGNNAAHLIGHKQAGGNRLAVANICGVSRVAWHGGIAVRYLLARINAMAAGKRRCFQRRRKELYQRRAMLPQQKRHGVISDIAHIVVMLARAASPLAPLGRRGALAAEEGRATNETTSLGAHLLSLLHFLRLCAGAQLCWRSAAGGVAGAWWWRRCAALSRNPRRGDASRCLLAYLR